MSHRLAFDGQLTREMIEKAHRLLVSRLPSKPHPWPEMDVGNPMHGFCDRDGVYHPIPSQPRGK